MQLPVPQSYNTFDWLLVGLLGWSTVTAFLRGIIRVLFSFAGLVGGIALASWYYSSVAAWMHGWISSWTVAEIAAFLSIAVGVMVAAGLLGRVLGKTAHAVGLGLPDRLLGGLFGFARGCLLGVAVMMAVAAFDPGSRWIAQSRLLPYFLDGAHAVSFVVPNDLQRRILHGAEELKHNAPEWIKPGPKRHNEV